MRTTDIEGMNVTTGPSTVPVARAWSRGPGEVARALAVGKVGIVRRLDSGSPVLARAMLHAQRSAGNASVAHLFRQEDGSGAMSSDHLEQSIEGARGGGQAMDEGTRTRMGEALGSDFGGVRIHTDGRAHELSTQLSARAFTTGQDIFFRQGEYNPGTSVGRELLAHELTHVVQQGGGTMRVACKLTVSDPADPEEREAEEVARRVVAQDHAPPPPRADDG